MSLTGAKEITPLLQKKTLLTHGLSQGKTTLFLLSTCIELHVGKLYKSYNYNIFLTQKLNLIVKMPKQLELFHQTCQYNDFFSDQFFLCYALYKRTERFWYFFVLLMSNS